MIHNNFFKAKTSLAMVRILTKEECLYNDVSLTENDFDQILDRNTWFSSPYAKISLPPFWKTSKPLKRKFYLVTK